MPKRTGIKSILIIGSGPIIIGQACEFDYAGAQACRALKEEGYRVVLINSNPATIMTDPQVADATYIEPLIPAAIIEIIKREKIDALLPTMGGQTALNLAKELGASGILKRLGVELIGASLDSIDRAEDREKFQNLVHQLGYETPRSFVVANLEEARKVLENLPLPLVIRASYTLGGSGSGLVEDEASYFETVRDGLDRSPIHKVIIEESIYGWKEFELEVMRDTQDNCVVVCTIENVTPTGVHTGDSITVAPALTLTDREIQYLRNASFDILREVGVSTGGANVQFAVHPKTGRIVVIEMNPRVSRSSALASKASGFPIAKIAAKLAVGYCLDEIRNEITQTTYAAFEPTLDYVVTKLPRFDFSKFPGASGRLTTSMQAVGEVMAIGGNFSESLQKAVRSLDFGVEGFPKIQVSEAILIDHLSHHYEDTLFYLAEAFRRNFTVDQLYQLTHIDPWFLRELEKLVACETLMKQEEILQSYEGLALLKSLGFSDKTIAACHDLPEKRLREIREGFGLFPLYKRVDTCAAEFESHTPYLYSTYTGFSLSSFPNACEARPENRKKVIILGSGANRIGQGIEFDYCCVKASQALASLNIQSIMINCNPETVSTDFEVADRLYFEPLTFETVLDIVLTEQRQGELLGCILQLGGQTPLSLVEALHATGVKILGTTAEMIHLAEDRKLFTEFALQNEIAQPRNFAVSCREELDKIKSLVTYPAILRPSYVIGGAAMAVVHGPEELTAHPLFQQVKNEHPILIEEYLENALELEVDAVSNGSEVYLGALMQQFEKLGIHSGDSSCSLTAYSVSETVQEEIKRQTVKICQLFQIKGFVNIQFALTNKEKLYVIEINPRCSRTIPFVSKASGVDLVAMGVKALLAGALPLQTPMSEVANLELKFVKKPVFSFQKIKDHFARTGPEMKSTGEVMGMGVNLEEAAAKAELADPFQRFSVATPLAVLIIFNSQDPIGTVQVAQKFLARQFTIYVDQEAELFEQNGIPVLQVEGSLELFIKNLYSSNSLQVICNFRHDLVLTQAHLAYIKLINELTIIECRTLEKVEAILMAFSLLKGNSFPVNALQDLRNDFYQAGSPLKVVQSV